MNCIKITYVKKNQLKEKDLIKRNQLKEKDLIKRKIELKKIVC